MKKPTKPNKPVAPKKPEQVYYITQSQSYSVGFETLAQLIDKVRSVGESSYTDYEGSLYQATGAPDFSKVSFEDEYDDYSNAVWDQEFRVTLSDKAFVKRMAAYEKALKKYQDKMAAYQINLKKYEDDTKAYLANRRAKTEALERKMLADLKGKYE